jgi:hypothetical protein
VLNGGDKVVPGMGMNRVWRTYKLVMLSVVQWLTTLWHVKVMQMVATKCTRWLMIYRHVLLSPAVRGVMENTTVGWPDMVALH